MWYIVAAIVVGLIVFLSIRHRKKKPLQIIKEVLNAVAAYSVIREENLLTSKDCTMHIFSQNAPDSCCIFSSLLCNGDLDLWLNKPECKDIKDWIDQGINAKLFKKEDFDGNFVLLTMKTISKFNAHDERIMPTIYRAIKEICPSLVPEFDGTKITI